MAVRTLPRRHGVRARQRKTRSVVIELSVSPQYRVMTGLACGRESGGHVRDGRQRTGVILHVARGARRIREGVVVVYVAVRALPRRCRVRSG